MPQIINIPGQGQVQFPDGMTDDQITAAIKANTPHKTAPQVAPGQSAPSGLAQGVRDTWDAAAQNLYHLLPHSVRDVGDSADKWLYQHTNGFMGNQTGGTFDKKLTADNAAYEAARRSAAPASMTSLVTGQKTPGFDWGRTGGQMVVPGLITAATDGIAAPAAGALAGYLTPVYGVNSDADYAKQKVIQTAGGAVLGKVGDKVVNGVASVVKPTLQAAQQRMVDAGVRLTPGQMLGGALKRMEDASTSIPFVGDMIKNGQRRSFIDMNNATINKSLAPIGVSLPPGKTGRDAISWAHGKISDAYDNVLGKIGATVPDDQFHAEIDKLRGMVGNLPAADADQFNRILDNELMSRFSGGAITSDGMKASESNLGNIARKYLSSEDYDKNTLGNAVNEAQNSLRNLVARANPQHAEELQNVNTSFANFIRPQVAAARQSSKGGIFSPEQLSSAVRQLDPSKRKNAFANGDALMQDFSDDALNVLGNTVPDSGTPLRSAAGAGFAAAAGHSMFPGVAAELVPPVAAGGALLAAPYTSLGMTLLSKSLQRPAGAQALANALRKTAPPVGAATSQLIDPALLNLLGGNPVTQN